MSRHLDAAMRLPLLVLFSLAGESRARYGKAYILRGSMKLSLYSPQRDHKPQSVRSCFAAQPQRHDYQTAQERFAQETFRLSMISPITPDVSLQTAPQAHALAEAGHKNFRITWSDLILNI